MLIRGQALRMGRHKTRIAIFGAALLLGGCSMVSDDFWPSLTGDEPVAEAPKQVVIKPSPAESQSSPTISPAPAAGQSAQTAATTTAPAATTAASTTAASGGTGASGGAPAVSATGTFVGAKVVQLSRELESLKSAIGNANARFQQLRSVTEQNAQRYYAIVAAISARLQIGTTPGNPVLVAQWNTAQSELDRILTDIAALNTLANDVASQAAMSSYLIESINAAYGLSGAVEEDHRQLARIEDEVNRTVVLIDRLLNEVNDTIARQTAYVNNERRNLTTLSLAIKNGELFGPPLTTRAFAAAVASQPAAAAKTTAARDIDSREPLVVIRFDRKDVPYEQALYTAVSQALDRRPTATFDVVAVAPNRGTPAQVALNTNQSKRSAEKVFRTLTEMGLSGDRLTLSATTSPRVQTNEVRVYVR